MSRKETQASYSSGNEGEGVERSSSAKDAGHRARRREKRERDREGEKEEKKGGFKAALKRLFTG